MAFDYPNDDDGDALRNVAECGSDMSKPMDVDFQVATADEATAQAIAESATALNYRTAIYFDEEADPSEVEDLWTCECTKTMLLTYEAVIAAQTELDQLAEPLGGYCDGWGTFGNVDAE